MRRRGRGWWKDRPGGEGPRSSERLLPKSVNSHCILFTGTLRPMTEHQTSAVAQAHHVLSIVQIPGPNPAPPASLSRPSLFLLLLLLPVAPPNNRQSCRNFIAACTPASSTTLNLPRGPHPPDRRTARRSSPQARSPLFPYRMGAPGRRVHGVLLSEKPLGIPAVPPVIQRLSHKGHLLRLPPHQQIRRAQNHV